MSDADSVFFFDNAGYLHLREALTPEEVSDFLAWAQALESCDLDALNSDYDAEARKAQLNRPVSRFIDADVRFAVLLDHPQTAPWLERFLGADYRHIDNDLYYTYPGYEGGDWHRGTAPHPAGHVEDGDFRCPMVKAFYCLTDVGPDEGAFVVVPGSHKANFDVPRDDMRDLPGQHIFDDVKAGDIILFNEGLLHTGRANPSAKTRKTAIVNFGRVDVGVWKGYRPRPETLERVNPRRREILGNGAVDWQGATPRQATFRDADPG